MGVFPAKRLITSIEMPASSGVPGPGESTVHTPWSTTVRLTASDQFASVTTEVPEGTATCRIFLDGKNVLGLVVEIDTGQLSFKRFGHGF